MKRWYIRRIVMTVVGLAAALACFYFLFCAFLRLAMDRPTDRRDVVITGQAVAPAARAAEDARDINVPGIEIYREGDGPAPAWYDPTEPMAAEWSANAQACDSQRSDGLKSDYILDVPLDADFQIYLHGLCEEAGVPYTLAVAVIEAESTYRADAVSDDGDYGLMQINWRCHEWLELELGVTDWLDPYQNARAGVWILGNYYRKYGAESGTLVAYNQGQQSAEELFAAGIYETDYSRRVIGIRWRIENGGAR